MQPSITALIEVTLWTSVFATSGKTEINGFGLKYYLSYALWATFTSRITSNWVYEIRMLEEIESGTINGLLVRPMSFFEYYLSQFIGYKAITTLISMTVPFLAILFFELPTNLPRLIPAFLLVFYYLFFVQLISLLVSTVAFHLTRVQSLTVAKNLGIWLLSGELLPLDLLPEPWKSGFLSLPFCNAVYIPVGYLTGRISFDMILHGFWTTTVGIVILSPLAWFAWRVGVRKYTGTGA